MKNSEIRKKRLFTIVTIAVATVCARGETNYWIGAANGNWENTNAWSLGILPDSSQSVWITNAGENTIAVTPETVRDHPDEMVVPQMTLGGEDTLLLAGLGTNVPFRVVSPDFSGNLLIKDMARFVNLDSGLFVNNLTVSDSGILSQDGVLLDARSTALHDDGQIQMTNGTVLSESLRLFDSSEFHQYGGAVTSQYVRVSGTYVQDDGNIFVSDDIGIDAGAFIQNGGTNLAGYHVWLETSSSTNRADYLLSGGYLQTRNVRLDSYGKFVQCGGIDVITETLWISGEFMNLPRSTDWVPGSRGFFLEDGELSVDEMEFSGSGATFVQENGDTTVTDAISLNVFPTDERATVRLKGGSLTCRHIRYERTGADIYQSGGVFAITSLFSFGGVIGTADFARYDFSGGTLFASNIELAADWNIGSSSETGRITNPGYFKMAGFLSISNDTEQLGRFILASNAVINFAGTNASLSFADSISEDWNSNAILLVTNWSGNRSGGGFTQLKFGANQVGLTPEQVSQIRFRTLDSPGLHSAKVLSTGEVVPDEPISGEVRIAEENENLILGWEPGWILQTATNLCGPYTDLPDAMPPFTNKMTEEPERFFRLR